MPARPSTTNTSRSASSTACSTCRRTPCTRSDSLLGIEAAGVHDGGLPALEHRGAVEAVARDAGHVAHERAPPADEPVEERGLAHVRAAHDGDDRAQHVRRRLPGPYRPSRAARRAGASGSTVVTGVPSEAARSAGVRSSRKTPAPSRIATAGTSTASPSSPAARPRLLELDLDVAAGEQPGHADAAPEELVGDGHEVDAEAVHHDADRAAPASAARTSRRSPRSRAAGAPGARAGGSPRGRRRPRSGARGRCRPRPPRSPRTRARRAAGGPPGGRARRRPTRSGCRACRGTRAASLRSRARARPPPPPSPCADRGAARDGA